MAYTPQTWTDGVSSLSAARFNYMEAGIDDADTRITVLEGVGVTPTPATTLPGSPTNKQQTILTDSTSAPTYYWLMQYNSTAAKWLFIGGSWKEGTTTVTVPIAGDWYCEIGAKRYQTASGTDVMTLTLSAGGVALDAGVGTHGGGTEAVSGSVFDKGKMIGLTASQVLTPTVAGTPTRQFIRIQPVKL